MRFRKRKSGWPAAIADSNAEKARLDRTAPWPADHRVEKDALDVALDYEPSKYYEVPADMSDGSHADADLVDVPLYALPVRADSLRPGPAVMAEQLAAVHRVLDKANQLDPNNFKRDEHLPPAFRQVDFREAFAALLTIVNEIEVAAGYTAAPVSGVR